MAAGATLIEASRQARWHVVPEWRGPNPEATPDLAALLGRGMTALKRGNRRAVYRADGAHAPLVVKHYQAGPWWRRLFAGWRPSAARREAEFAQRLIDAGLPTPRPLAWFEVQTGAHRGESCLLTEELTDAVSLDQVPAVAQGSRREQARLRRQMAESLVELMVAAHRAGFEHGDLHAGNLLVRRAELTAVAGEVARLFLIDFGASRWRPTFRGRSAEAALIRLAASFRQWHSPCVLRRFVARYVALRPELQPIDVAAWGRRIERQAQQLASRIARRRDRRAWQSNRDYRQRLVPEGRASFAAEIHPDSVDTLLREPERFVARHLHAPLKLGAASLVIKAELADAAAPSAARPVVCKRLKARRFWQAPWAWWARRRARRAWQTAVALQARGLPVARPLALLLPKRGPAAYLLTDYVPGAVNLHLFAWELARRPTGPRREAAARTAEELGRLVGALHAWGIAHRDLKGCNLMVVEEPHRLRTPLVDLDGIVVRRRIARRERVRNLARLAASLRMHEWIGRALALRFLYAYAREMRADRAERRRLWREVAQAAHRLESRRKRRNAAVG